MDTLDAEINKYIVTRHKEYLANPAGGAVVISNIAGPNFAPVTHVAGIGWDAAKVRDVTSSFLASLAKSNNNPTLEAMSRLASRAPCCAMSRWIVAIRFDGPLIAEVVMAIAHDEMTLIGPAVDVSTFKSDCIEAVIQRLDTLHAGANVVPKPMFGNMPVGEA